MTLSNLEVITNNSIEDIAVIYDFVSTTTAITNYNRMCIIDIDHLLKLWRVSWLQRVRVINVHHEYHLQRVPCLIQRVLPL